MRKHTVRGRLAVSLAVVAVLAAAGCGSQSNEPQEKDWDEGSKSEQQSGSNDKSNDDQDKSDQQDDGGKVERRAGDDDPLKPDSEIKAEAEAFIADYLDAQNAATKDGDFSRVDAMIEECQVCDASRSTIEEVYTRGGKVKGGLFEDPKIHADWQKEGEVGLTVVTALGSYEIVDASGTVVDSGEAEEDTFRYTITKKSGEWKIVGGSAQK